MMQVLTHVTFPHHPPCQTNKPAHSWLMLDVYAYAMERALRPKLGIRELASEVERRVIVKKT